MTDRGIYLTVLCTDKGQHPSILLGVLTAQPNGGMVRANLVAPLGVAIAERRKDECVWLDHLDPDRAEYRVHMRCPRCRRHVQWSDDRVLEVLPQLHAAGLQHIDVSIIPS